MIRELLRRSGVVVTAAPEFLVRQELLERMADMLLKFIERWRKSGTNPAWFLPETRIHKHIRNGVHAFQLYRIAYPGVAVKQVQEQDQYAMTARALRIKPTPEMLAASEFRVLSHIFWHLTIVFTDDSCVRTAGASPELGAVFISDPVSAIALPVYRGTQSFGAAPDAEEAAPAGMKHIRRGAVIHEFKHAFQDYGGTHVWTLSHLEPRDAAGEGVSRDYYLRPVEIDARLAELVASLRRRIQHLVKSYQDEVRLYLQYVRLHREGKDIPSMPGQKVTPQIVEMYRRSAVRQEAAGKLRAIFAHGIDGFMTYCESVIKAEHPELHKFLDDSTNDLAKSYATRHLSSELREVWEDMQERYKNVLPRLTEKVKPAPGEHYYQYGRPREMR